MGDPRTTAARGGVAARELEGRIPAEKYSDGVEQAVKSPFLDLLTQLGDSSLASQLLFGERFTVYGYDPDTGKVWGQSGTDGYVGYVDPGGLADPGPHDAMVTSAFAPIYSSASIKSRPIVILPFGSRLPLGAQDGDFFAIAGGFVHGQNIAPLELDIAGVAERFIGAPYLWGGRSPAGLDCSALVQLSLLAVGVPCPRDSDMQWQELGTVVDLDAAARNDLVFWKGHVGIIGNDGNLIHATGHHMAVVSEPFADVLARIEAGGDGDFLGVKRLAD